ncbi:MAG: hypothetical protein JXB15_04035 [Anaerolineales bacterium]|nr:hypothetical protein [Anaerolineales bacterium]
MAVIRTYFHHEREFHIFSVKESDPFAGLEMDVAAPGAGKISFSPIQLSAQEVKAGKGLEVTATISGENIAYVFNELWLYDPPQKQAYGPLWRGYIETPRRRFFFGWKRPVWSDTQDLSFTIKPGLRCLTDGAAASLTCLVPEKYGLKDNDSPLVTSGEMISADSGKRRKARLFFDDERRLRKVIGYSGRGGFGSPRAMVLQPSDQFIPELSILSALEEGGQWPEKSALGDPLTFGEAGLTWIDEEPIAGSYLVGFAVQDLDGNWTRKLTGVVVT